MVRQRVVNGFDFGITQELFVRTIGFRDSQRPSGFLGLVEIARCDGANRAPFAFLHGGYGFANSEVSGAQDSPANFVRHGSISVK